MIQNKEMYRKLLQNEGMHYKMSQNEGTYLKKKCIQNHKIKMISCLTLKPTFQQKTKVFEMWFGQSEYRSLKDSLFMPDKS